MEVEVDYNLIIREMQNLKQTIQSGATTVLGEPPGDVESYSETEEYASLEAPQHPDTASEPNDKVSVGKAYTLNNLGSTNSYTTIKVERSSAQGREFIVLSQGFNPTIVLVLTTVGNREYITINNMTLPMDEFLHFETIEYKYYRKENIDYTENEILNHELRSAYAISFNGYVLLKTKTATYTIQNMNVPYILMAVSLLRDKVHVASTSVVTPVAPIFVPAAPVVAPEPTPVPVAAPEPKSWWAMTKSFLGLE